MRWRVSTINRLLKNRKQYQNPAPRENAVVAPSTWGQTKDPLPETRRIERRSAACAPRNHYRRGAWWNAGTLHMHAAVTKQLLAQWDLLSLLDQRRAPAGIRLNRRVRPRTQDGVGGRASYPMISGGHN